MPKINFLPYEIKIDASLGETILEVAMKYGIHINASCGGRGVCNKCRILIEEGVVQGEILEEGFYKACTTVPITDIVVRIPPESLVDRVALLRSPKTKPLALIREERRKVDSPYFKIYAELPVPTIHENASDLIRIRKFLEEKGIKNFEIPFYVLKKLPYVIRKNNFKVTLNLYHDPRIDKYYLVDIEEGNTTENHLGVAIDIGTTTLSLELLDLNTGEILAHTSDYNPQISYGEDVISRIEFAKKKEGLRLLSSRVRERLVFLMEEMIKTAHKNLNDISLLSISGNTVMMHLFLELEPKFLREYPYVPVTVEFPIFWARDLDLPLKDGAIVQLSPCVASYVGGDITAGVLASGMAQEEPLTLFIDLGTNGEIVIGNKDFLISAACSAGPAFEGGGIKHGVRATSGSIEMINIHPTTYEPMILTIGRRRPIGICGSGIIALLANLFMVGLIDQAGNYRRDVNTSRIRKGEDGWEYVVVWKEDTRVGHDIVFTEADIENVIRAKGAMFAGYQILLESIGLSLDDLARIYLAGTFGSYIDLEEAITIGLLPDLPREKFYFLGNTSLQGAKKVLLYKEDLLELHRIARMMTHVELSAHPKYMEYYIATQFIPHTNLKLFPSVKIPR